MDKSEKPFSLIIKAENIKAIIFSSGHIANDLGGDITQQTKEVFENLKASLGTVGASLADVVKATVFLKTINDLPKVDEFFYLYLPQRPTRSSVGNAELVKGALIEIEVITVLK